jgi:hypothetical protein
MKRPLLTLTILCQFFAAHADVTPLPQSQWPSTVAAAVPYIVATMRPMQRSIVSGTSQDSLFLLQSEWGEDIEQLLGLNKGNSALVDAACGQPCSVEQATLKLMEATWEALKQ